MGVPSPAIPTVYHSPLEGPMIPHIVRRRLLALAAFTFLPLSAAPPVQAQEGGTLRGSVVSQATMRPLAGAQVFLPASGRGTVSNAGGQFLIPNVPAGQHLVRVQLLGFAIAEQTVTVTAGEVTQLEFSLAEQALALDEVVVTGQAGAARRREVGNAITQINMSAVKEPAPTVENLIQASAPGVRVAVTDATVGSGAVIRLRGNVSTTQSNQPLIYIDGVRMAEDAYRSGVNTKQASPLGDINPNDIERIEIIKGAAAATLYGSEAAAGVIQIFTRRGQTGDPRWTYQLDQSLSWVRPWGSDERPRLNMDPWLQNAYGHTHTLSLTGGAPRVRYFVAGNFADRDGTQVDEYENRYGIRTNVTVEATEKLTLDVNSSFSRHVFETQPSGNALNSIFFNVYRTPNNFVGGALPGDPEFENQINTLRVLDNETRNDRTVLGFTANYVPFENLTARFTVGYDRMGQEQMETEPFGHPTTPAGRIVASRWSAQSLTTDASVSYRFRLGESVGGTFSTGGQLVRRETELINGQGDGLPGPGRHTLSSTAQRNVTQSGEKVNTGGFFVQQMLDFNDRFFVTAGVRVDGSSAFGEDFGLEVYPKVSGSWVVSEEGFWPASLGDVKLRAAYGFAGRAPGAFDATRTWTAISYQNQNAFVPSNIGNANLGPERTGELEVGFEGSFLANRVDVDFTYYNQKTTEALFNVPQPWTSGFGGSQLENVGELQNTGIELGIDVGLIETGSISWRLGTDITTNNSKVLDTGGVESSTVVEGQPAPVLRGARITNPDEFADPIYEFNAFIGPHEPTRIIGLSTSLELPGGVSLTARGEYMGGHYAREFSSNLMAQRTGAGAVGCDHVYRIIPHDRSYLGPGDDHPNLGQVRAWDRALCFARSRADAWNLPLDFAKLREVTLQAPMPFALPRVENATLTLSARNLFRWVNSDFYSHDPEALGAGSQITSLTGGSITDHVPAPASFVLSIRASF